MNTDRASWLGQYSSIHMAKSLHEQKESLAEAALQMVWDELITIKEKSRGVYPCGGFLKSGTET